MAKIYSNGKSLANTEKMAIVYDYIADHYETCKTLVEDIKEKRMSREDKRMVFSGEQLSITDKLRYKPLIRRNEEILKEVKDLGPEEFILGLSSFIDINRKYESEEKVSASMKNLASFQRRLKELGFESAFISDDSSSLNMQLRFEENFITDGEIADYNVVDPGVFSNLFGDDSQRLEVQLKDASFVIVKELDSFRDKESFTERAYVLSNYPSQNKLKSETKESLFQTEHPLMKDLNQYIQEEDYADNYKRLYDDRISFFQDIKLMKKEAKKLGIFERIIQDVENTDMEELMDRDDLNLLKAIMLKGRTISNIPKQKENKK